VKALEAQASTRAATKVDSVERRTGQSELFDSLHEMSENEAKQFLDYERSKARETLLALTPVLPGTIAYKDLWPKVLAKHVVMKPEVNKIAAALRKESQIVFPGWEKGKRVPQPAYLMHRAV
jgi:hypothetical protein